MQNCSFAFISEQIYEASIQPSMILFISHFTRLGVRNTWSLLLSPLLEFRFVSRPLNGKISPPPLSPLPNHLNQRVGVSDKLWRTGDRFGDSISADCTVYKWILLFRTWHSPNLLPKFRNFVRIRGERGTFMKHMTTAMHAVIRHMCYCDTHTIGE